MALLSHPSPCPTFNQDQTDDFYKDRTYDVPGDHDPTDRVKAFELSLRADGYPIGVIYKREDKHSLLDEQASLRERFEGGASLDKLLQKFA